MAALPAGHCRGASSAARPIAIGSPGCGPSEITDRRALGRSAADPQIRADRVAAARPALRRVCGGAGFGAAPHLSPRPARSTSPRRRRPDFFRLARALFAAGFRAGDLVHNTFSYHLTPAGAMVESAAQALGCPVIPAGTGQTEQQLRTIADLKPVGYVGTPSFLKILLDRAAETRAATSPR